MAAYTQSEPFEQQPLLSVLALSYKTLEESGWEARSAGDNYIAGVTPKSWATGSQHIFIEAGEESITVTSSAAEDSGWNRTGVNKKKVASFITSFNQVKMDAALHSLEAWELKVKALQAQTETDIANEAKTNEAIEQVMNLSGGSRVITYSIMGINALIFLLMVVQGVGLMNPESADLISWGANYGPLTLNGEWWRLLTCVFIHIGVVHLLFNMYALYAIGNYLEPMLGKAKYASAYLATGVFASLLSLWWHKDQTVSAGASGAIFGLYGLFLALLTTNIIPKVVRRQMLQSIGIFIFYNLAYGMKAGIDNAAHLGGLMSGFAIGYIYYWTLRNPTQKKSSLAIGGLLAASLLAAMLLLMRSKDDTLVYQQKLIAFDRLQEQAMKPLNDSTYNSLEAQRIDLEEISLPAWKQSKTLIEETKGLSLSEVFKKQRSLLLHYIELRIEETHLFIEINKGNAGAKKALLVIEGQLEKNIRAMNALFK